MQALLRLPVARPWGLSSYVLSNAKGTDVKQRQLILLVVIAALGTISFGALGQPTHGSLVEQSDQSAGYWTGGHGVHSRFEDRARSRAVDGHLTLAWSSPEIDTTRSVAWGDWDGDGDLDLAVGNTYSQPHRVYRNEGGDLTLAWSSEERDNTRSVAWGDWDGDGDLDLAAGNDGPNQVYRNDGGDLTLAWSSEESDDTYSVAWGDWDSDGDLDLAVGNFEGPNRVYDNEGGALTLAWSAPQSDLTPSVAWGDWDADGDLDLAVGNDGQPHSVSRKRWGNESAAQIGSGACREGAAGAALGVCAPCGRQEPASSSPPSPRRPAPRPGAARRPAS